MTNKLFSHRVKSILAFAIFCYVFLLFISSCAPKTKIRQELYDLSDYAWIDKDSAFVLLSQMDTAEMCTFEKNYWHLLYMRVWRNIHIDECGYEGGPGIDSLIVYFEKEGDAYYIGDAYYEKATLLEANGDGVNATEFLLKTEDMWKNIEVSAIKQGMLKKRFANCASDEHFSQEAIGYYTEALQILEKTPVHPMYTTEICRHLAREYNEIRDTANQNYYSRKAFDYVNGDEALYHDCMSFYYRLNTEEHSLRKAMAHAKYLVDSLDYTKKALVLASWYLYYNEPDSAKPYLDIARQNPRLRRTQDVMYRDLWGHYLFQKDYIEAAYHNQCRVIEAMEKDANKRKQAYTFEANRRYADLRHQRELTIVRYKHILLAGGITAISALLIILLVLRHRRRQNVALQAQNRLLEENNKLLEERNRALQENQKMEASLAEKQVKIRTQLEQKINLSRQLSIHHARHAELPDNAPKWLSDYLNELQFANIISSEEFIDLINSSYNDCLNRWATEYPALTPRDLQHLALVILGFDPTDISLLQDMSLGSVNNRHSIIKKRLGLAQEDNLRKWIENELH